MRLFFALQLSQEAKSRLRPVIEAARRASGDGTSFTRPEQLHFTLAFLGEQPESALQSLAHAGEAVCALPAFDLAIAGAGAFPDRRRPHVLWLGVSEGGEHLCALAEKLCAALRERGFALEERPFRPHLTIARIKRGGADKMLRSAPEGELARMRAEEICLVQSVLGSGGATHSVLRGFALEPK